MSGDGRQGGGDGAGGDRAPGIAAPADPWAEDTDDRAPGEMLVVDLAGFEGPLDLLLALARTQKVDLTQISVLALAEQYLVFIGEAQKLRLELAADYLVMAAWLAFLKSRLLLPREEIREHETSPEEMAARLQFRLQRLAAMRQAAAQLFTRQRLGRDVFPRGMPEGTRTIRQTEYSAEIYDLLKAYSQQRIRTIKSVHVVKKRTVWSIKDARQRLERLVGQSTGEWLQLDLFLESYLPAPELTRTVIASSFGATLEMAREGVVELQQKAPFAPIYMRKTGSGSWGRVG